MDECDVGTATADKFLKAEIVRAREQKPDYGTMICEDCGYLIDKARKKAAPNCTRCIICQKDWERHNGNF